MKRKILSLIVLALCLCLCFALASCGEDENDDKKGSGKNKVTFDSIVENLEDLVSSNAEFDPSDDPNEAYEILYDFFGQELIDEYSGEYKSSLMCDSGEGWGVIVIECGDEDEASELESLMDRYSNEFYYISTGKLVLASNSQYMLHVAIGEEEFDADKVAKSIIGYQ